MSSFELFDVPQRWSIDLATLKRTFLQYQQKVHPDLFAGQGDKEQWAKIWSGRVNDAYKILAEGRSRGEYLLSLSDVHIGEADAVTDPELLMDIMEVRESLEEAETEDQVSQIRDANKQSMNATFAELSTILDAQTPDLEAARNLLIKLKYLENIEGVCREWQPGKRIELQH
ncbi:molecular chaperone [Microbotryomycetes sp. JL221]|nr:molecular chaperone [Microbotryomycetes sp. JL221]